MIVGWTAKWTTCREDGQIQTWDRAVAGTQESIEIEIEDEGADGA